MKADEIVNLTSEELAKKVSESREELFNLRFQHATGALENTARIAAVKRQIARFMTVERARKMDGA